MEVLTYEEFNQWLYIFGHSLSKVLETWGERLLIGDDGIGLVGDDAYEPPVRKWLN